MAARPSTSPPRNGATGGEGATDDAPATLPMRRPHENPIYAETIDIPPGVTAIRFEVHDPRTATTILRQPGALVRETDDVLVLIAPAPSRRPSSGSRSARAAP